MLQGYAKGIIMQGIPSFNREIGVEDDKIKLNPRGKAVTPDCRRARQRQHDYLKLPQRGPL